MEHQQLCKLHFPTVMWACDSHLRGRMSWDFLRANFPLFLSPQCPNLMELCILVYHHSFYHRPEKAGEIQHLLSLSQPSRGQPMNCHPYSWCLIQSAYVLNINKSLLVFLFKKKHPSYFLNLQLVLNNVWICRKMNSSCYCISFTWRTIFWLIFPLWFFLIY